MLWTKLDWSPPAPAGLGDGGQPPEVAVMGGLVSFLQLLIKKKPEPVFVARGFLGIELADRKEGGVVINAVLDDSPAAKAGLKPGDRLLKFQDKGVRRLAELHPIVTEHAGKDQLELEIDRDGKLLKVTVTPGRGL
jgi:S1-C subfamily serine protease